MIKLKSKLKSVTNKIIKIFIIIIESSITIANGVTPSQAIGVPILAPRIEYINSNTNLLALAKPFTNDLLPIAKTKIDSIIYKDTNCKYSNYQITQCYSLTDQFITGFISMEQFVLELRGGGFDLETVLAIGLTVAVMVMMYNNGFEVEGFKPIRPPHHQWMPGTNSRPPGYNSNSRLNSKNKKSRINSNFIKVAYDQIPALDLEGTENQITAWSVAKHAHHGPDFGIDPTDYGMTYEDLNNIAKIGLINHINQGGKPPTVEYIKTLQNHWKVFAEQKNVKKYPNQTVMGEKCFVIKDKNSGLFVSFKDSTGESFTGYKLTRNQSIRHENSGQIGRNYFSD